MVWTYAAATISVASSQLARTRPPLPRADLYAFARSGLSTMCAQALTGSPSCWDLATRYICSSTPRMYG